MANEIQSVVGKIDSVSVIRSGTTQKEGRNISWTLFEVIINGQKYGAFDAQYQNLTGKTGEWKYKTEMRQGRDGRTFENKTLLNVPKLSTADILPELKEINRKLDILLGTKQTELADGPDDYEPDPDEIPIVEG